MEYNNLNGELKQLTFAFEERQRELDQLRKQAGDDAHNTAVALGKAEAETTVLILEIKKYEGLHKFMEMERDLILRAQ